MITIYKLTCPNGKCYIGQTGADKLEKRWQYGHGYSHNKTMFDDIVFYGWKNWKKEVLITVEDKAAALRLEGEFIEQFDAANPACGYNSHKNKKSRPKVYHYTRCIETGELFPTMEAAGRKYNRSIAAISYAISKKSACAGLHWEKYDVAVDDEMFQHQ